MAQLSNGLKEYKHFCNLSKLETQSSKYQKLHLCSNFSLAENLVWKFYYPKSSSKFEKNKNKPSALHLQSIE